MFKYFGKKMIVLNTIQIIFLISNLRIKLILILN